MLELALHSPELFLLISRTQSSSFQPGGPCLASRMVSGWDWRGLSVKSSSCLDRVLWNGSQSFCLYAGGGTHVPARAKQAGASFRLERDSSGLAKKFTLPTTVERKPAYLVYSSQKVVGIWQWAAMGELWFGRLHVGLVRSATLH